MITAPRSVELVDRPCPEPAAGQVRVRIEGCGVCGSDLPVWQGRDWFEYPRPPGAPGHEPWGVVDAVGSEVTGLRAGDRVAGLLYRAYSEYDLADAGVLVRLPESLDGQPFPGEPLACAINVFRRSGIAAGDTVAILGIGFLGALVTQLAADAGARVIAVGRRPFAQRMALQMGASEALAPEGAVARVEELTAGELCDVVVEAAGVQSTLALAGPLARVRGRVVIAGFHQDGLREVDMQLWNWRGLDVINAHERDPAVYLDGLRRAVKAVVAGHLDPTPLYTHRFPLDGIDTALAALDERPDGFMKALLTP